MTLLATLIRIEAIKSVRRFGFWMAILSLWGLLILIYGGTYYSAVRSGNPPPHLPDAWSDIILTTGPLAGFFGSVALILLVAAEFSWNTARQNVIDGLSKEQFFLGKLLLVPAIALVVFGVQLGVGGAVALLGNVRLGQGWWPLVEPLQLGFALGTLLQFTGFLALAFLAAMIARSAGGAMGLFLLYAAVLEQILGGLMRQRDGWLAAAADFLPVAVFSNVGQRVVWDPEALAQAVARATSQGRPPPEVMGASGSVAATLGWTGLLIFLSFVVYQKRDL